jgi:hypothetical protein
VVWNLVDYPVGEDRQRSLEECVLWRIFGTKRVEVVQQHIRMNSCWFCTFCRILFRWLNDSTCTAESGKKNYLIDLNRADPRGRTVSGVSLRQLACWDWVSESRQEHGCLCLVSVVRRQLEGPAAGQSLVQRSPTECDVAKYKRQALIMRRPWTTRGCCTMVEKT